MALIDSKGTVEGIKAVSQLGLGAVIAILLGLVLHQNSQERAAQVAGMDQTRTYIIEILRISLENVNHSLKNSDMQVKLINQNLKAIAGILQNTRAVNEEMISVLDAQTRVLVSLKNEQRAK